MPEWTHDYFERGYARRWGLRPPTEQVRAEARGLWDLLHLTSGARVVDIGCGHGRHALALAERGADVVGIDAAVALLARARDLSLELGAPVRWIRGDMRRLPLQSECAGAALLMDAFGFFETEDEHETVLREAARVLAAGGVLVMKVVNGAPVLADFRDFVQEDRDGVVVSLSNTLTLSPARMTQRISMTGHGGQHEYERRQRLYHAEELRDILMRSGFAVEGVLASPDGTGFDANVSPRIWMTARRANIANR